MVRKKLETPPPKKKVNKIKLKNTGGNDDDGNI